MLDRTILLSLIGSGTMLIVVLELVRQRKLREEYSLLWLATSIIILILATNRILLSSLAKILGIFYPPSALFLIATIFILLIILHFSTVLTRLTQENKEIAQQVALLRQELEEVQTDLEKQVRNTNEETDKSQKIE